MTKSHSLDSLTAEHFRGIEGTRFQASHQTAEGSQSASAEIELVNVSEFPENAAGTFRKPFSLVFHGPVDKVLPQGIHRLEHEQLGVLEVFMVPIGPDEPSAPGEAAKAMRYEAVFG
ncbi:MAG TPA: hypothetical protein VGI74_15975 [Streptosporangiaceae bacterium]|jgi:hypothetical protein